MKRILFAVCGEGFGHAKRTLSVLEKLKGEYEVKVLGYDSSFKMLNGHCDRLGFELIETLPDYQTAVSGSRVDLKSTVDLLPLFLRTFKASTLERKVLNEFKPDLVFSDSKLSTTFLAAVKKIPNIMLVNQISTYKLLPERMRFKPVKKSIPLFEHLLADRVNRLLFSTLPAPYNLGQGLTDVESMGPPKVEFVGPVLSFDPVSRRNNHKSRVVMSTLSGTGSGLSILKKLKEVSDSSSYKFKVTTSGKEVDIKPSKNFDMREEFVSDADILKMYDSSNVYVGSGGYTALAEALSYGLPVLSSYPSGHLEKQRNTENLERLNVGINLGINPSVNKIHESLDTVFADKSYFDKAHKFQELYKYFNGAERCADIVRELV